MDSLTLIHGICGMTIEPNCKARKTMTNYLLPLLHKKPLANPRLRKIAEHRLAAQLSDPTLLPLPYVIPTHCRYLAQLIKEYLLLNKHGLPC